ncbi:MAG: hypothetical protein IIA64_05745 [Planctomycetes bacterium]|nr:hypothetical protein [Planctomycetota bacterium]
MTATAACEYFPNTTQPVPKLLTALEAVRFLRLDIDRESETAALRALQRLVERRLIRPAIHVGKRFYDRNELIRYVDSLTEEYPDAR